MSSESRRRSHYWLALRERAVWRRAAKLGLVVGFIQVSLNQGDHWLRGDVTPRLILKSVSSLMFAILVVLLASASTRAEALRNTPSS